MAKRMRKTRKGLSETTKPYGADVPVRSRSPQGPKRAVNLSIDAEILRVAKDLKINLSQILEDELRKLVREERIRRFKKENREALESFDRLIAENGIFGEEFRNW